MFSSSLSFKNNITIYQQQILCEIDQSDYNLSYNPSLLTTSGSVKNFATGSDFSPYMTTIGLYNDDGELLMVSKVPNPVLISPTTDMTFVIKVDI